MMSDSPQCFKCVHVHEGLVFVHMFDMRLCDYVHVYVMSTKCSKITKSCRVSPPPTTTTSPCCNSTTITTAALCILDYALYYQWLTHCNK